jgi:hypothetical protein
METVPDLVFLSCCHLGKVGANEGGNRLAASLARELIDMGVRCVVAAGWEVQDEAALTFAETFFTALAREGARFGDAVFRARQAALDAHPDCNTWAAYQAYGDPTFQLTLNSGPASDDAALLAPEELLDWLEQRGLDARLHDHRNGKEQPDFRLLQQRVRRRLGQVSPDWAERPDVQQTLGRLYGEYGTAGFKEARAALLRAIDGESSHGVVAIGTIERLVRLEVGQAERLSRPSDGQDLAEARKLIDGAIARLSALIALASDYPALGAAEKAVAVCPNRERQAVLGSAWRCQAIVRLRAGDADWPAARGVLRQARDAYARAEGDAAAADWDPCSRIQRLLLDAVLGSDSDACRADAKHCEHVARARFERDCRLPDAAMSAEAVLAAWLANGILPGEGAVNAEDALVEPYRDSLRMAAGSPAKGASGAEQLMVEQVRVLAEFIGLRGGEGDDERARVLKALAMRLGAA